MPAAYVLYIVRLFCCLLSCSLLAACIPAGKQPESGKNAAEYRQQAYRSISQKRYADGVELLTRAIRRSPSGEDLLLLGDLQEALGIYRKAADSYRQGLAIAASQETRQSLLYRAATLASMELAKPAEAADLQRQLPQNSPAAHNLQASRLLAAGKPSEALQQLQQALDAPAVEQELKGWAYFHSARARVALEQKDAAFQALFFAVNHARGHGLVKRITRLWEELKQQDREADRATNS